MTKLIVSMRTMLLILALCMTTVSAEQLMGGWEIPAAEANPLTEEAQAAFDKAMEKLVVAGHPDRGRNQLLHPVPDDSGRTEREAALDSGLHLCGPARKR